MSARSETGDERGNSAGLRRLLVFVASAFAFELLFVGWIAGSSWFTGYLRATAQASAWALRAFGCEATSVRSTLHLRAGPIELLRGCDGLEAIGLLALAILFLPLPWPRKLVAIALGGAVLLALNLVRVVSLALLWSGWPTAFETCHAVLWPIVFLLATVLLWRASSARMRPRSP